MKDGQTAKIICTCAGTTEEKIIELINKGKNDLDQIASATGATTGCNSCDVQILEIIEHHQFKAK